MADKQLFDVAILEGAPFENPRSLTAPMSVEATSADDVFFRCVARLVDQYPDFPNFYESVSVVVRDHGAPDGVLYELGQVDDPSAVGLVAIGQEPDEQWLPSFNVSD